MMINGVKLSLSKKLKRPILAKVTVKNPLPPIYTKCTAHDESRRCFLAHSKDTMG